MANYFLHVKTFARGQGSKVTKAAAYRAGERIRDERTSAVYDHTGRMDVAHAEIVLPSVYGLRGRSNIDILLAQCISRRCIPCKSLNGGIVWRFDCPQQ